MKEHIVVNKDLVIGRYKYMNPNTHKGIQGHALVIGGSYGKMGAICLSSRAALKSGCGLVTAFIPRSGYTIVQVVNPEVMVITDECEKYISKIKYDISPQAIALGPGLGQEVQTQNAFHDF